jgi:hypothetical protein
MANQAAFAPIPALGSAILSATADSSYTAPTHTVTIAAGQGPRQVTDGVTNSTTTVTSATAAFSIGDIGRPVSGAGIPAGTVIAAVASATSITISAPATATASGVTLTLGGGVGALVQEVVAIGTGTTVAGMVELFTFDGTVYHHFDTLPVTVVTPSTTIAPFRLVRDYVNLWLAPGWSLVATSWVASQLINMHCAQLNS